MTPFTPHQRPLSHWHISEAHGSSPSRSKLVSLGFASKSRPVGADRALHPSGAPSIGRAQSATAFSSDPTAACCRCQWMMVGFAQPLWMSTRSMHLLKVPGGPTVRLHHLMAITIVPGTIFASEGCAPQSMVRRAMSHVPGALHHMPKHACTHCEAAEIFDELVLVHLLSPRVATVVL